MQTYLLQSTLDPLISFCYTLQPAYVGGCGIVLRHGDHTLVLRIDSRGVGYLYPIPFKIQQRARMSLSGGNLNG